MDRDKRWERTERAYRLLVHGEGERATDPVAAITKSYERGVTDEFVEPVVVTRAGRLAGGDRWPTATPSSSSTSAPTARAS